MTPSHAVIYSLHYTHPSAKVAQLKSTLPLWLGIRRSTLIVFLFLTLGRDIFADGGTVQISKRAGPLRITIFTTSAIVHAGLEDVSVLVQDYFTHRPLLNAKVCLSFQRLNKQPITTEETWTPPCCRVKSDPTVYQATHAAATNKLLYAVTVVFPAAGKWEVQVEVSSPDVRNSVNGTLHVAPPASPLLDYWPLFLFPIIAIIGYIVHYRLCHTHAHENRGST